MKEREHKEHMNYKEFVTKMFPTFDHINNQLQTQEDWVSLKDSLKGQEQKLETGKAV